jgi:anti-anti-sigma factor
VARVGNAGSTRISNDVISFCFHAASNLNPRRATLLQYRGSAVTDDRFSASVNVHIPREGVAVVEFVGEQDLATTTETAALLTRLVSENDRVVIDLCAATFIDSSFISCLLIADRDATELGHEFRLLVSDSPNVTAALDVTGIADRLTIISGREQI